ncbi:non-structural polyprotein [Kashmir bee virus]|uniref:Non-structural polyprotein n=12 Tax=Kashmir bee virus TaxID=68876 RepID=Q80AG3_9VIRU|nr:non-structural polyprotein [Kashmir bee virus]AAP32283.1 non-structural polyprotein [Kashmir bee virus]
MFSSTQQNNKMTKQPATLTYLSSMKVISMPPSEFFSLDDLCRQQILKMVYIDQYAFHMLHEDINCIGFTLSIYDEDKRMKDITYWDLNCEYHENLYDALMSAEFEQVWFTLLLKYLDFVPVPMNWRGMPEFPTIYVSKHFWYELYRIGFLNKLYKCGTWESVLNLLAGDIELNPGPTDISYKEQCQRRQRRKRISKSYEEIKMQQHIDKVIREEFRSHQTKPKKLKDVIDVSMQGLFNFQEEKDIIKSTAYKFNDTLDKSNHIMDNLIPQLEETLAGFRRTYAKCEQKLFGTISIIDVCIDIISALLQVSFAKASMKLASLAVEVFRLIKKYVGSVKINIDKIKELLTFGKQALDVDNPIIQVKMQIDMPDYTTLLQPNVIVSAIFLVLSVIFTRTLPTKTGMEAMIKRIGDLGRAAKGVSDLNSVLNNSISTMLEHFGVHTLGLKQEAELQLLVQGYKAWCDEVRALVGHKIKLDGDFDGKSIVEEIMKDVHEIQRVENLYKQGLDIARNISDMKLPSKLTISFNTHMRYLTEVFKAVDTSGAFGNKPRTQPVVIWLYGESGRGKSGMTWPLAVDLNNSLLDDVTEMRNFSKNIYMRNVEQEFWDNYQGQNIVVYDDFGQMRDSTANPNPEFMELIRTANIAPYPLHMAHLEDKRKTKFTSKVIIMTSNVFEQSVNSLTFPDAFRRRVDLCAEVRNKEEYTKEGYSKQKGCMVKRLDREKVQKLTGDIHSTKPYLVDLVNAETGEKYKTDIEYEDFLDMCLEKTKTCRDESAKLNEFLMNYAEQRKDRSRDTFIHPEPEYDDDEFKDTLEVQMQIDAPNDDLVLIEQDRLREMIDSCTGVVYDCKQQVVKISKLAFDLAPLDYDEQMQRIKEMKYYQKVASGVSYLKKVLDAGLAICKTWIEETVKYVQEHPWTTAMAILGTLLGILTVVGFWKWLCSGEKKKPQATKRHFVNTGVTLVIPHRDLNKFWQLDETLDVSNMRVGDVEDHLAALLKPRHRVVIVPRVTKFILSIIDNHSKLFDKTILITKNRFFTYENKYIELVCGEMNRFFEEDPESLVNTPKVEAFASADLATYKNRTPIVIEAQTSGDNMTLKQPRPVVIEAQTSADCVTLAKNTQRMIEAFASSDTVTLKRPTTKYVEGTGYDTVDVSMQMWRDQVAQKLITNRILTNLYKICLVNDDDTVTPLLNGLFIRSNVMLVPGHLTGFIAEHDTIEIRNLFDVVFRVPWKEVKKITVENALGESKEAALLAFPKFVCQHSDIVKHFQTAESMSKFKRCEVTLPVLRYSQKLERFMSSLIECDKVEACDKTYTLNDVKKGQYILRQGLEYTMPTIDGDCGAPLIINETQVTRKIAGIHVAGAACGRAYAESITQKDLERTFSKIDVTMQIQLDLDSSLDFSRTEPKIPAGVEFGPEALTFCDLPALKMIPVGRLPEPLFEPGKTDIRPSLVHGMISDIKTKPAYLRNVRVDGEVINMKHRNLMKCAMDTPYIDKDMIEEAYQLTKSVWLKGMRDELKKVLTYEEAICGSEVSEYISSINRSSSPGYPWIKDRVKGTKGKQGWFGTDGEFILNEDVELAVQRRLQAAREGKRLPVMWVDTLKDERRPIEKVNQLKTRVFSNGPMDFSIAFRMYYLGFIAHLMENRITNEVSIGTNVYSQDWSKTVRKLTKFGNKVIAGDFSTFDGSLNVCIMEKFADLANEFYDDGPENALIRHVLLMDVYNSVHVCNDSVYMMTHSQPSGNPATTPLNCFINSMGLRMCFSICATKAAVKMTMRDFSKHVSLVSYGDDNVINFSDEVSAWYNMSTIAEAFSTLGFTYTDELKGVRGEVPNWRSIQDVQYLKRKFRYDNQRKVWEAPLCMDTILEMPNWCRGGLDIQEGTKLNCENAIMELSMHEEEVFDKWSKVIDKAYAKATGDHLDINTYRGYAQERYLEYYM